MDDEQVIKLVERTAALVSKDTERALLAEKVIKIETELPHIIDDLEELKNQKKEDRKDIETKKDKKFSKVFVVIGAFCGIIGLLTTIFFKIIDFLKKP